MKKCIICNQEAIYRIKDTSDYYCQECAEDNFAEVSLLVKVEEEARILKDLIEKNINNENEDVTD